MKQNIILTHSLNIFLTITILAIPYCAFANENLTNLATDPRMKIVSYNPYDIITIIGNHLVATDIEFERQESIISVNIGDSLAWVYSVPKAIPYILSIKPVIPTSDTNMTVITNKRIYHFHLVTSPHDTPQSHSVTYGILFRYLDNNSSNFNNDSNTISDFNSFIAQNTSFNFMQQLTWNDNYSFTGSKTIAPIKAFDNGTFTVFKFAKNESIPAIFAVDAKRNESLLNVHTQVDYVFIQGVYPQYTFRSGSNVTSVYDDSYSASS